MAKSIEKNALIKAIGIRKNIFIIGDSVYIKNRFNLLFFQNLLWFLDAFYLFLVLLSLFISFLVPYSGKKMFLIFFVFCFAVFYSGFVRKFIARQVLGSFISLGFNYISRIIFKKPVGNSNGLIEFIIDTKKIGIHTFETNTKVEFLIEELSNFENLKMEIEKKINLLPSDSKSDTDKKTNETNADSKFVPKDNYSELERLFQLKEKGIITEDDYNKKKEQILGL